LQGTVGATGSQGSTGSTGSQGTAGSQGTTGTTGSQGVQGTQGIQGIQGLDGGMLTPGTYVGKAIKNGTAQTIPNGADTVVTLIDDFDPNGWFTSNKFQPTIGGYYLVNAQVWWEAGSVNNNQTNIQLRKNGSTQVSIAQNPIANTTIGYFQSINTIIYFNGTTDYIELTAFTGNPTSQNIAGIRIRYLVRCCIICIWSSGYSRYPGYLLVHKVP